MKFIAVFILIVLGSFKCPKKERLPLVCSEFKAELLAKKKIEKKGGLDLEELNIQIIEDSLYFEIKFYPKDTKVLGGGGLIKISKSDCKIVEKEFYQ